jgi:transketolase
MKTSSDSESRSKGDAAVADPEVIIRPYARHFVEWAKDKPDVLCLSADLTGSCEVDDFRDAYPDRFISCGMAEQNMMAFAGGLAREGFIPIVHTFGVFVTRRPYDQVAMSIGYPNLKVRLMGFLPGVMTPGGVTHQAIDDVALMRSIPNMTVLACGDATDVESILEVTEDIDGPVYCRVLRGEVQKLFDTPMRLDRARLLSEGTDVCVLTEGVCTSEALHAVAALREKGVSVSHLHVSTLKPFTDPAILEAVAGVRFGIITMENHLVSGGLGTVTSELITDHGLGKRLVRIGLRDTYAHGGSLRYLMDYCGLSAQNLVDEVERLIERPLGIKLGPRPVEKSESAAPANAESL